MTSLAEVLSRARTFWEAKGASSRMMPLRAERCLQMLTANGVPKDEPSSWQRATCGTTLLGLLAAEGLARKTQAEYYAAFRRALTLSGISTIDWPKAPVAPRRVREPITSSDTARARSWLFAHDYSETAHLSAAIEATGMRVQVEALSPDALTFGHTEKGGFVKVIGKGGHERVIPVANVYNLRDWLECAQRVPYATHLDRWNKAVTALGISSRMPTFHAIRHLYATQAYHRSGKNLVAVKELLGHADVSVTAGYIGVDLDELRKAAGA